MPCTGDIFNHNNKELVGIKWSCKGAANLSEQAGSGFVGSKGDVSVYVRAFVCSLSRYWLLGISDTLLSSPCLLRLPLSADSTPRHDCRPTNFITTALNCTVLEPSNYSSLRCGRVEKGRKSTEVGVPGLELRKNWKQMIGPFPCLLVPSPSLCTTPSFTVGLLWLPGTGKKKKLKD